MKSFQVVVWLRFAAGDAVPPHADRLVGDIVAEISQRAGDPVISPAGVLACEPHHKRFYFWRDAWSTGVRAMLRSVELRGDQSAVPGENCVRPGNTGHLRQSLASEPLSDL